MGNKKRVRNFLACFKHIRSNDHWMGNAVMHEGGQLLVSARTKLHGCNRLYKGKKFARLFWLLMALSTCIVFIIVLVELFESYKHGNISTQVQIVYDYASPPSITICSHNPVRWTYVKWLQIFTSMSDELLEYIMHVYLRVQNYHPQMGDKLYAGDQLFQKYIAQNSNFTLDKFVEQASFVCKDAFVSCAFEGIAFNCCDSRYLKSVMTDFGRCYQYDWDRLASDLSTSYNFGSIRGLQVLLDYQSYDAFRLNRKVHDQNGSDYTRLKPFFESFEPGFRLYIHDKHSMPHIGSDIIVASPNIKMSSGIKPIKYEFLDKSIGGHCCSNWPSEFERNETYSSSLCYLSCLAQHYRQSCGCVPLHFTIIGESKLCTPKALFDCKFGDKNVTDYIETNVLPSPCHKCFPECQIYKYFTQNSIIRNILSAVSDYMVRIKKQYRPRYVRENLASVHVFFAAKKYQNFSQSTLSDLTNFLSKIGSYMGLLFGASSISIFEITLALFKMIWAITLPRRAIHLLEKTSREIEKKRRIEKIINESALWMTTADATDGNDVPLNNRLKSMSQYESQQAERNDVQSDFDSPMVARRKYGRIMPFDLTAEQANIILQAENPQIDSIFVSLRPALGKKRSFGSKRRSVSVI